MDAVKEVAKAGGVAALIMYVYRLAYNLLNLAALAGGLLVQLPQIHKIYKSKSVTGLSEIAWIIQVYSTGAYVAYNYIKRVNFALWGDAFFAVCEYAIIVGQIWNYGPKHPNPYFRIAVVLITLTAVTLIVFRLLPGLVVELLGLAPIPLVIIGRVPQILLIQKRKDAGALSLSSLAMQTSGNCWRLYTALTDKQFLPIIFMSHLTAFICNGIPLLQCLAYGTKGDSEEKRAPSSLRPSKASESSASKATKTQTQSSGLKRRMNKEL